MFLGREDASYRTSNDDGTYFQSSASRSCFAWDHGKHERHFMHDDQSLPILHLSTGLNYYQTFCSRVKQSYNDAVHFAFSLAHSIISDDVWTHLRSHERAPQAVTPVMDFILGQDVLYTDGQGNQEQVVYKGATRRMVSGIPSNKAILQNLLLLEAIFIFLSNPTSLIFLRHHLITTMRWMLDYPRKKPSI